MFKRKKTVTHTGAKYFENNINTLELVSTNSSELLLRPSVIEKAFNSAEDATNFLSALRLVEGKSNLDVYANGIKIEQVSLEFLNKKVKLITGKVNSEQSLINKTVLEKLEEVDLTDNEKNELCLAYADNPNVVVFYNYKTELNEKQLEKLKGPLLSLFCDAIILFVNVK